MCQDAGNVASRWIVSKDKVPYGRWASYRCTHLNLNYWLLIETTSATHSMLRHQSRRTTSTRTSPISPLAALRKNCLQLLPRGPLLLRHLIHHGNGEERGAVNLSKWSWFLVKGFRSLVSTSRMMRIGKSMQYFFAFWHSEIEDSSDRVMDVLNSPVWVCWQEGFIQLAKDTVPTVTKCKDRLRSPSMVPPLFMHFVRQDANKDIRHATWQSNCWVRFGGMPLKALKP